MVKRQELSVEVGLTKEKDGLRVRDRAQEARVLDNAVEAAASLGLDADLTKKLLSLLIADSVETQRGRKAKPLTGKKALVVGGAGKMGAWTCRFLSNRGASASVWDDRGRLDGYPNVKSVGASARSADIIAIASPPGTCAAHLGAVMASRPKGLVFDLCSVKSHLVKQLRQGVREGLGVTSVHTMFGPNVPSPKGHNVIVCDCGSGDAVAGAADLFASAGANVTLLDLDEHDRLMTYVLGLSHLSVLLFVSALKDSGLPVAALEGAQGPSFRKLTWTAKETASESRRVYHDIQALNPHTRYMLVSVEARLRELKRAALDSDPLKFAEIMDSSKEYLGGLSDG